MKSTSIIFITFNSITKHLLHALQMHTHTYIQRVHNSEPYSGIQGRHKCLWTLVDHNMYMRHVDIFPYYSLCFSSHIFSQKDFIIPYIIANRITDFPHHHNIMYDFTPLYSPVQSTFSCYLCQSPGSARPISFFVSVFLIWTLLLYARTNLAYLLLCPQLSSALCSVSVSIVIQLRNQAIPSSINSCRYASVIFSQKINIDFRPRSFL